MGKPKTLISLIPEGVWFKKDQLGGFIYPNLVSPSVVRWVNMLVLQGRLQRIYREVDGRKKAHYIKPIQEIKPRNIQRTCLVCNKPFTPEHKFNFVCCRVIGDEIRYLVLIILISLAPQIAQASNGDGFASQSFNQWTRDTQEVQRRNELEQADQRYRDQQQQLQNDRFNRASEALTDSYTTHDSPLNRPSMMDSPLWALPE